MRPLMVANIHELRGQSFLCAHVYDDGYVLARIIAPTGEKTLAEKMREIVWVNCDDFPAFDVYTCTESIYLACLGESDINGHFKTREDTSETFRDFEDEQTQAALIDIYKLEDPNKIEHKNHMPKWRRVLIEYLQKAIKLLEGESKNEMETIR